MHYARGNEREGDDVRREASSSGRGRDYLSEGVRGAEVSRKMRGSIRSLFIMSKLLTIYFRRFVNSLSGVCPLRLNAVPNVSGNHRLVLGKTVRHPR